MGEDAPPVLVQPLAEAQPLRFYSGMGERQRLVIRDGETWANIWGQIASPFQPVPAVPAIDFASHVVIVASMGSRPTGGYSIEVDEVRVAAGDAQISITERSPGNGCVVTDAFTAPVAVVVVPRLAGQATFVEHTTQDPCS